jgi:hypothetical protein
VTIFKINIVKHVSRIGIEDFINHNYFKIGNQQQPITTNNKKGILLVNLGSPKSTDVNDVKNYLDEFLMDEKVIDYRWIFEHFWFKVLF